MSWILSELQWDNIVCVLIAWTQSKQNLTEQHIVLCDMQTILSFACKFGTYVST